MSVFARGVLVSCMGLGVTACSETSHNLYAPSGKAWQNLPLNHAASYVPQTQPRAPYVRMAQNNAAPGLRGPSHVRKAILQQYHFDDIARQNNVVAPAVQTNSPFVQPSNSVVQDVPRQYFQHQLEEAAPRQARNYASPVQHVQPAPAPKVQQIIQSYPAQSHTVQGYSTQGNALQSNVVQGYPTQGNALPSNVVQSPQPTTQNYAGQTVSVIGETLPVPQTNFQPASQGASTPIGQSLSTAVQQSSRLAIEDLKIQEAEEQLEQAKSQGRFKLNLEGTVGASQNEIDFRVVDRTDSDFRVPRAAGLNLSLPLYQGGRINAQKDVAKVDVETAKANYQVVQSNITEQAGIAHMDVLRDRALIVVYTRNVALLQSQKETVEVLLRAGENTVTDQALVDARLASIQASLKQAQSNLSSSESRYKKLTGFPAPALSPVQEFALPDSLQSAKETAFSNNSRLLAMRSQSEAAYHNIRVAKSLGRPRLALQGGLRASEGQSDTIRRASAAELLLNLSVPILSGGENKSRVREAALAQSRSALETRAIQEDITERLEQLWAAVSAAKQSQSLNVAQKMAAEKAYEAILSQRNAGVATTLDVLSVEQTLLDAELNIIQAENSEGVARFQILGLIGAL